MNDASSGRQRFLYSLGRVGGGVYDGFNSAILPLYIQAFTNNPFVIGYLSDSKTMEGVVIQPLIGRWSDRLVNPLGRRRPFMLVGIPLSALFLLLVPILGHVGGSALLPLIAGAIILFSITYNVAGDPYDALMIDITPERDRPVFSAVLNVISLAGQVLIVIYTSVASVAKNNIPDVVFYVVAGLLLLSYGTVFLTVREPKEAIAAASREEKIPLRVYMREMGAFKEAMKLLVSVFFLWNGLYAILPYFTTFIVKTMHVSKSHGLIVYAVLILSAAIFAYPFGRLGRQYGLRRFIILGTGILVLGAIGGLIVPSYALLFPVAVLAGAGFAATNALTYPYLAQLVPEAKIGVFTGLYTAFRAVALPVSILMAGTLIDHFGYRSIFAMLAVMVVVDAVILFSIDDRAAEQQVRSVEVAEDRMVGAPATVPVS